MNSLIALFNRTKIPTVVALVVLLAATAVGWYWVWGVFFLYWGIAAIVMRQAFVVQTVRQDEKPVLFWFICATWIILSVVTILADLATASFLPETLREQLDCWVNWECAAE